MDGRHIGAVDALVQPVEQGLAPLSRQIISVGGCPVIGQEAVLHAGNQNGTVPFREIGIHSPHFPIVELDFGQERIVPVRAVVMAAGIHHAIPCASHGADSGRVRIDSASVNAL